MLNTHLYLNVKLQPRLAWVSIKTGIWRSGAKTGYYSSPGCVGEPYAKRLQGLGFESTTDHLLHVILPIFLSALYYLAKK